MEIKPIKPKLYNKGDEELGSNVSFRTMDAKKKVIKNTENCQCFAPLTYSPIVDIAFIEVYHSLKRLPYSWKIVEKWVAELNELGFPMELSKDKENVNFLLDLKNYHKKYHLSSALMLIRCVYEKRIAYVPEIYFGLLESGAEDKFLTLQQAHFNLSNFEQSYYYNSNHTVTSKQEEGLKPISRENYFKKLEASKFLLSNGHPTEGRMHSFWSEDVPQEKQNEKV